MNRVLCASIPYFHPQNIPVAIALHFEDDGYDYHSKGLVFGFGHPKFIIDLDDDDEVIWTTCTRCSHRTVLA